MSAHNVQWMAPAPFWAAPVAKEETPGQNGLSRPAILRFASDDFMAHYLAVLERDPKKLKGLIAEWETWREAPSAPPSQALLEPAKPQSALAKKLERLRIAKISSVFANKQHESSKEYRLKLYQPAHQRFYLVVASLVCGIVGFPDRTVDTGKQERVSFVVRRLVPKDKGAPIDKLDIKPDEKPDEYAFVQGPEGPRWVKAQEERGLVAGEEQLPFFPTQFSDDQGHRRRVWSALIPVGKREAYLGAQVQWPTVPSGGTGGSVAPEADVKVEDPRMTLVRGEFLEPWKRCHEKAVATNEMLTDQSNSGLDDTKRNTARKAAREQIQTQSWYALLDFARFLKDHISRVWNAVETGAAVTGMTTEERTLLTAMGSVKIGTTLLTKLGSQATGTAIEALRAIMGSEGGIPIADKLENVVTSYTVGSPDWPTMLFPLADPEVLDEPLPAISVSIEQSEMSELTLSRQALLRRTKIIDEFGELVAAALPQTATAKMPAVRAAAQAVTTAKDGWFVIRCLFQREACGPLHPPIISDPTMPFQMASFFDPDAPARPIRIPLPLDTTPAGLRKFDKNTAFLVSDVLCGQMTRLKSLGLIDLIRAVLPWPLHKDLDVPDKGPCKDGDGNAIGMLCSISIPIVTICALVLLMVIVSLLDLIFRWIPYFILCFPLPKFKGKSP